MYLSSELLTDGLPLIFTEGSEVAASDVICCQCEKSYRNGERM